MEKKEPVPIALPRPVWAQEIIDRIDQIPLVLELTMALQQQKEIVFRVRAQRDMLFSTIKELQQKLENITNERQKGSD